MQGLRQILKVTAQRMAEDREGRGPAVSVEVLGEEDDEVEGREDAESYTGSVNGSDVDDLGDRFEGATTHERLPAPVASASEHASPPDSECDSTRAVGARLEGRRDDQDVYRETLTFLLGVEDDETGAQGFATELNILRERGVTAELVSRMDHTELAVSMAAHMVVYEQVRLPQFVKLRGCLVETFIELSISGLALVGDHAIPADEFFELVVDGLSTSNIFRSIAGYKSSLRRFLENVYGGSRDKCSTFLSDTVHSKLQFQENVTARAAGVDSAHGKLARRGEVRKPSRARCAALLCQKQLSTPSIADMSTAASRDIHEPQKARLDWHLPQATFFLYIR
jgi:hypothetical protein